MGVSRTPVREAIRKLELEGLFDEARKKKIPRMPKKIGIVTASTGAAIHDVTSSIQKRCKTEILIFPCLSYKTLVIKKIKIPIDSILRPLLFTSVLELLNNNYYCYLKST